jgi:2'-5' RNA ligase
MIIFNMNKAIDIVIIPPDHIIDYSIKLNRAVGAKDLILSRKTTVPHITLLMGGAEEDELDSIWQNVKEIAKTFKPLNLEINKVIDSKIKGLEIKRTRELLKLHNHLVKGISPLLSYENKKQSLLAEKPRQKSIDWVNGFLKNSTGKKYHPHITIGDGNFKKVSLDLPINFKASKIALYHLGNHCTCRKVIYEMSLI